MNLHRGYSAGLNGLSKALPEAGALLPNFGSQLKARSECRALNAQLAPSWGYSAGPGLLSKYPA